MHSDKSGVAGITYLQGQYEKDNELERKILQSSFPNVTDQLSSAWSEIAPKEPNSLIYSLKYIAVRSPLDVSL